MRILFISNTPFLPATAGNRARIHQMVEFFLKHGAEVGMLLIPASDLAEWDVEAMRTRLAYFEIATPSGPPGRSGIRTMLAGGVVGRVAKRMNRLIDGAHSRELGPIGVDDWCPTWFREHAARIAQEWVPDVVMIEYVFLSACLDHLGRKVSSRTRTVIDTHDIMHQRAAAYAEAGLEPQWFLTTYAEEQRGLARADTVLAISDADASVLREMIPKRTVLTVPHGHEVRPAAPEQALPYRGLFVASYNDLNVGGLRWFLDAVWPLLKASEPAVELAVCGNVCDKLGELPAGVVALGFVPSLAAEYARARVVINPVHAGTGLKVKVAEALCHGRPVVSTRQGATGIATGDDEGVLVADSALDFATAMCRLFEDSDRWTRLVATATAHAARRFSPEAAFTPLIKHLTSASSAESPSLP